MPYRQEKYSRPILGRFLGAIKPQYENIGLEPAKLIVVCIRPGCLGDICGPLSGSLSV